jgi:hypothetical protein
MVMVVNINAIKEMKIRITGFVRKGCDENINHSVRMLYAIVWAAV